MTTRQTAFKNKFNWVGQASSASLKILVVLTMANFAWAQADLDEDLNSEIDRISQQAKNGNASSSVQVNVQQPQQQAPQVQQRVQKQPTTIIEATPLMESPTERLRKARQESELQTEQKIVEKLEQSRMEDERRRSDALFGDRINNLNGQQQQQPVVVPVTQVVPAQTIVAPIAEIKEEKKPSRRIFVGGLGGIPGYMDANNVRGNYSAGVAVGSKLSDSMIVQGDFLASNYELTQRDGALIGTNYYNRVTNVDHYSFDFAIKGVFMEGSFQPNAGGVVAFSYRTYRDTRWNLLNNQADSQSLDWGLTTGFDFDLTEKFALGIDFRYMWNLTYKTSTANYQNIYTTPNNGNNNPLERLSYYQLLFLAKYNF